MVVSKKGKVFRLKGISINFFFKEKMKKQEYGRRSTTKRLAVIMCKYLKTQLFRTTVFDFAIGQSRIGSFGENFC